MISKQLTHNLDSYQVTQQRIDGDHLEQQADPSHKHHHITAGEVIQEVLEDRQEEDTLAL